MFSKLLIFFVVAALTTSEVYAARELAYHAVYVQHFDQDLMEYNNGNALSIITNSLQREVGILNEHHVYAHELIAALSSVCTSHVLSMTNIKDVLDPIPTHIFTYDDEAASLLPFVRIMQPDESQGDVLATRQKKRGKKKPATKPATKPARQPTKPSSEAVVDEDEDDTMDYLEL